MSQGDAQKVPGALVVVLIECSNIKIYEDVLLLPVVLFTSFPRARHSSGNGVSSESGIIGWTRVVTVFPPKAN